MPWRRGWHPTPLLLPGEFHGRRSLGGYSPRGHEELVTLATNTHTHTELIFSVVLVSGVQRGDSVTHTPTCLFVYRSFSTTRYYVTVLVARWVWLFATHGLQPTRLLCPWKSPGKNPGAVQSFPSPGSLPDPGCKPRSPALLAGSLPSEPAGKPLGHGRTVPCSVPRPSTLHRKEHLLSPHSRCSPSFPPW